MNRAAVMRATLLPAACLLVLMRGGFAPASAENRAHGIFLHKDPGRTRCMVRLDQRPVYGLRASDGGRVHLLLHGTEGSGDFLERIADEASLEPDPASGDPDVGILFTLPAPLREASAAWLADRNALYLEFVHDGSGEPSSGVQPVDSTLRPLHFGFLDMRTRMVLHLDRPPAWDFTDLGRGRMRLHLPRVRPSFDRSRYGPAGNLAVARLQTRGSDTAIDIQLRTRIDRIRVFRARDGRRLVTDLYQGEPVPAPATAAAASGATPLAGVSPGLSATLRQGSGTTSNDPPEPGLSTAEPTVAEGGPVFRGRIASGGSPDSGDESEAPGTVPPRTGREGASEEDILRELAPEEVLLYGEIRRAFDKEDPGAAVELCRRFLEHFPGSPVVERVAFLQGDAEFARIEKGEKDRFSTMMKTYQKAISQFKQSPRVPRAYLNMALASSLLGNDYAAIGYLNIVLHSAGAPETVARARLERGRVYLEVNQPDKAVEDFKAVLENHPESAAAREARMDIARYFEAVGLHGKARETLDGIARTDPDFHLHHPEFLFLRGKNALYLKRYQAARDHFFRALNIGGQPEGADLILTRIGDTYHHASRPKEAEIFYRTVIREYPDSDGASIAGLRLAGYEDGYQAFREFRQDHAGKPVDDLAALEMARKFYEEKQYARALEVLRELLDKPFQNEMKMEAQRIFYRIAEQEMKRLHGEGRAEALVDFYLSRQALLRRNVDPEIILLVGLSLHESERHQEAADLLESIKPYDLNQVSKGRRALTLTRSLIAEGEEDRALALLEKREDRALLPAADRQELDLILAGLYRKRGRSREAYELYRGLLGGNRLLPDADVASVQLAMGRIERERGALEQARTVLNRCIDLAERLDNPGPILRQAYRELGAACAGDGLHEAALEAYEKALEQGYAPDEEGYWELRFQMAQAYLALGDYGRAEPLLVEISEQGEGPLQQRVRLRLGALGLEEQLRKLSSWSEGN